MNELEKNLWQLVQSNTDEGALIAFFIFLSDLFHSVAFCVSDGFLISVKGDFCKTSILTCNNVWAKCWDT